MRGTHSHLTFSQVRWHNVKRCRRSWNQDPEMAGPGEWSATDWGCALAGEVGELCNLLKKRLRGEPIPLQAIADEAADIVLYLDLLCAHLGIDLGAAVVSKFNEVSEKRASDVRIPDNGAVVWRKGYPKSPQPF